MTGPGSARRSTMHRSAWPSAALDRATGGLGAFLALTPLDLVRPSDRDEAERASTAGRSSASAGTGRIWGLLSTSELLGG